MRIYPEMLLNQDNNDNNKEYKIKGFLENYCIY